MINMARVLIAGAGHLGLALAERLKTNHHEIILARRSPQTTAGMTSVMCDFGDKPTLKSLPEVVAIFYAAAADESTEMAYQRAYSDGVKNLLAHYQAFEHKPQFYLSSSTSVYAATRGQRFQCQRKQGTERST